MYTYSTTETRRGTHMDLKTAHKIYQFVDIIKTTKINKPIHEITQFQVGT